jgi:hypothetical protein
LLVPGGSILICIHVNAPSGYRSAHFMTVEEHLATFKGAGFVKPREICPAAALSLMAAESCKAELFESVLGVRTIRRHASTIVSFVRLSSSFRIHRGLRKLCPFIYFVHD